jgi:hypothetical protein
MAGSGEDVGIGIGNVGGEQRQRAFSFGGESFEIASSYASGVGLVVPMDQPSRGGSSRSDTGSIVEKLGNGTSPSATTTPETGINISELSALSATSRPRRSRVPSTRNPQSNSLDVRDIKHPQPQSSDVYINGPRRGNDVVPVWDVNTSTNNQRIEQPESGVPRVDSTSGDSMQSMRKDIVTGEPEEMENSHYVLTNAVLRDLVSAAFASCRIGLTSVTARSTTYPTFFCDARGRITKQPSSRAEPT